MAKLNLWLATALLSGLGSSVIAQNAISAKAGLVQVADGEVFVNDKAVENKVAQFTDLKNKDVLTTGDGRAEVLLTPGAFLRVTDGSGIRMVSTRLSDVRMEMVKGEAIVEVAELLTDNSISMNIGSTSFELRKGGIYRFDTTPGRMRVYQGEANATEGDKAVIVKPGHEFANSGNAWALGHFDTKETDALYRWSSRRSGDISVANVSAARQAGTSYGNSYGSYSGLMNSGMMYGGMDLGMYGAMATGMYGGMYGGMGSGMYGGMYGGMGGMGGGWMFNPYFGMYTFMPFYDTAWSPFGYAYYTPITVGPVYAYAPRQSVMPVNPRKGGPVAPGRSAPGRITPAFTASSGLRSSAITRGTTVGYSRTGFTGSRGGFGSGYGGRSYMGPASSNTAVGNSMAISSSAGRVGGGGGGGGVASSPGGGAGGGGGGPRSH